MDAIDAEITRVVDPVEDEALRKRDRLRPARILLIAPQEEQEPDLIAAIESMGHGCICVDRLDQALVLIESDRFELILVSTSIEGEAHELARRLNERSPASKLIVFCTEPSVEATIRAMRFGAIDFLSPPVCDGELRERIGAALERSRSDQRREQRLTRLRAVCRELNDARREIAEQLDSLCREMVSAYEEMNEQISEAAMASEFRTLVRQELDVEDLLRTALEYLLTKTGPTNAAVFLADGSRTYSLGAYVNYDCPRETIAEVLGHLGSAICPQMAGEPDIVSFEDAREFAQWLNIDAGMLAESNVIAFSCMDGEECVAVVVLFRTASKPFAEALSAVIDTLRPIFAAQLANVSRVHHRALPSWPKEAKDESDEFDFDEHGYGFGGLAA